MTEEQHEALLDRREDKRVDKIYNTPRIFVVLGTYNRAHLLARSLNKYPKDVTIIVMDDGSTDNTMEVCKANPNVYYEFLGLKEGWRDSASYLNKGIKQALSLGAEYVFITHPEIVPGKTTIKSAVELAVDKETWISCKGYYLTAKEQQQYADYPDRDIRTVPGFYAKNKSPEFNGNKDYLPENIERSQVWDSWIFGGGSREMWQYFGGVTEFNNWGSVDVDLNDRRRIGEMKTVTPGKPTDFVIHQNHDDLNTPRDMSACMAALHKYETKEQCLKPELLL